MKIDVNGKIVTNVETGEVLPANAMCFLVEDGTPVACSLRLTLPIEDVTLDGRAINADNCQLYKGEKEPEIKICNLNFYVTNNPEEDLAAFRAAVRVFEEHCLLFPQIVPGEIDD